MAKRAPLEVEEVRSDMTPMIDVVFLMIIFFVCIDFRVLESKLAAFLPRDAGASREQAPPEEQLVVRVDVTAPGEVQLGRGSGVHGRPPRFTLTSHRTAWQIGPKRFDEANAAMSELQRLAADPSLLVPDRATGGRKRMRCVIESGPATRYDDIAKAADACHAAGFGDIAFSSVPGR
jgi:biopolymer transport protein ExbD